MFANGRKTIGLIIGETTQEYQQEICHCMQERAEQLGYNLAIFIIYGHYGISRDYYQSGLGLFEIPAYDKLAGLILAFDTFNQGDYESEVRELLLKKIRKELNCPVVSLREELAGVNNILLDEKTTMEGVIRHIIEDHWARDIAFMTGVEGRYDAEQRLACFRRIMDEYGFPVGENRVFYGDFWKMRAGDACDHFLAGGKVPEAILCANDYMAMAVIGELHARGYRVPDDIIVTGYDGLEEGLVFSPSLSTVKVDFRDMAYQTIDLIDRHQDDPKTLETLYARTKVVPRQSCGCLGKECQEITAKRSGKYMDNMWQEHLEMQISLMSIEFASVCEIQDIHNIIDKYIYTIEDFQDYYICLRDDLETYREKFNGFTEKMHLYVGIKDRKHMGDVDIVFDKSVLLPEEVMDPEPQCYYFTPIHYANRCFGYEAYKFQKEKECGIMYIRWNIALSNAIEGILSRKHMSAVLQEMEAMYTTDVMTGLFNRRGFEKYGRRLFTRARALDEVVAVIGIDMDGLKPINDIYGHHEGDSALRAVGYAINEAALSEQVGARIGGDEYEVIFPCQSEEDVRHWISCFEASLDRYNKKSDKPYNVYASWGYKVGVPGVSETMESYMKESDDIMYKNKVANKMRRNEEFR